VFGYGHTIFSFSDYEFGCFRRKQAIFSSVANYTACACWIDNLSYNVTRCDNLWALCALLFQLNINYCYYYYYGDDDVVNHDAPTLLVKIVSHAEQLSHSYHAHINVECVTVQCPWPSLNESSPKLVCVCVVTCWTMLTHCLSNVHPQRQPSNVQVYVGLAKCTWV